MDLTVIENEVDPILYTPFLQNSFLFQYDVTRRLFSHAAGSKNGYCPRAVNPVIGLYYFNNVRILGCTDCVVMPKIDLYFDSLLTVRSEIFLAITFRLSLCFAYGHLPV